MVGKQVKNKEFPRMKKEGKISVYKTTYLYLEAFYEGWPRNPELLFGSYSRSYWRISLSIQLKGAKNFPFQLFYVVSLKTT